MRLQNKFKAIAKSFRDEIGIYRLVLKDARTPKLAKILLWLAVGYMLLPFDLIPDFIPVVGHLDDAVIIPLLVWGALKLIPKGIVQEYRNKVRET